MKGKIRVILTISLSLFLMGCFSMMAQLDTKEVPRISREELKAQLGSPDLIVIDVRSETQWYLSKSRIPGAIWEDYTKSDSWLESYPKEKTIVFYCA